MDRTHSTLLATVSLCLVVMRAPAQILNGLEFPKPARSAGQQDSDASALSGTWTGTARESLESGGEVKYPITVVVQGSDDKLRLEVTGTAKVEGEDGSQLTLAILASYLGTSKSGQVRMASQKVQVRVVELDRLMPAQPQELTGRLVDGVFTGRVGSEADGWTTFEVRKKGAAEPVGEPAPAREGTATGALTAAALTGSWRGTGREPGPNGKELSYPVVLRFSGTANALVAELSAEVHYPVPGGGSVVTQVTGVFKGAHNPDGARLRAPEVKVRIVEQDRTETGPGQDMTLRLDGGMLRARVGSDAQGWSELALRREAAATTAAGSEGSAGTEGRTAKGRAQAPYSTLVLERKEVADPGMAGIASHTLLVPKGWSFTGGVQWTADPENYVHFVGALRGEQDESLHFDFNRRLTYSTAPDPNAGPWVPGAARPDGSIFQAPPQREGGAAVEVVVPRLHPAATGLRIVEVKRMPDVEQKQRAILAPVLKLTEESAERLRQMGGPLRTDSRTWLAAERVRVEYEEGGRAWEEEVRYVTLGFVTTTQSQWMSSESALWTVYEVKTARAPLGKLDPLMPTLWSLAGSLQETPRWSAALAAIKQAISEARHRSAMSTIQQIAERGRDLAKSRAELSEIQMSTWRQGQESQAAIHKAHIQTISEVQDFRASDGTTHSVTNHFERAFHEIGGNIILTNDPNYRPAADPAVNRKTWEQMQRIDPLQTERR